MPQRSHNHAVRPAVLLPVLLLTAGCAAGRQSPAAAPDPPATPVVAPAPRPESTRAAASAPAVAPAPVPAPGVTTSVFSSGTLSGDTRARIDALLAQPAFEHAQLSLVVTSLGSGDTLYRANGAQLFIPASTQKVVTTAVAAETLGWNFRFETRLLAAGSVRRGRLDGDLVVVGSGDPTLSRYHPGRMALFDTWAQTVKDAGITHVRGRIVGVDDAFEEPGWSPGWSWEDLAEDYGAPISALQLNGSEARVMVAPARTPGAPALVSLSPEDTGLVIDNRVVTSAAGTARTTAVARVPGTSVLIVSGDMPLDAAPRALDTTVPNPTTFYVATFRSALRRHGIRVDGPAVDADEVAVKPDPSTFRLLAVDLSPPLSELVDVTNKWSRNDYAETLLRAVDLTSPGATIDGGLRTVRRVLDAWGVPAEGVRSFDGSGLSRYDGLSADALVAILKAVWARPHLRDTFIDTLPLAGASGTLASRMTNGSAQGRVRAKTGSMFNVRTLAGYITTASGDTLAVAFMANGFLQRASDVDALSDEILALLAR